MMKAVTILGATGSIGQSTLNVLAAHPEQFEVFALTAATNVDAMRKLCEQFRPRYAVMADPTAAQALTAQLTGRTTKVLAGSEGLCEVASAGDVDIVMAAIVGAAGLLPTLAAVEAGKKVLLANKEALVMSGQLFMDAVTRHQAQLLPVDSEHNAIFQCLPESAQQLGLVDLAAAGVHKILLTGSGGPFRELPIAALAEQTPAAACAHPNWDMGRKISVDSATMLNKGLEYIEARWLFNCQPQQLEVLLHPQSVIHSMVSYADGSVIAQMGQADMRTPIAHCLSYPQRLESGVAALDFSQVAQLTFAQAEPARYPCLFLAQQACWEGQWATTSLNAANEVAVAAFLAGKIKFTQISQICERVLEQSSAAHVTALEDVLAIDQQARRYAQEVMEQRANV